MSTAVAERKAPPKPPAPDDPVTRYATSVLSGEVTSCRAVRLACERHISDMSRQRTDLFPFYFDPKAAKGIIEFFPTFLTLETGEPFRLVGWQQFCLGSCFGWKRASDDGRRFQTAYIETAKGSGKSPLLAGVALYCLAFDDEQAAEIYSAAFDRDQASIIVNDAIRMAQAEPELNSDDGGILEIGKYNIAHPASRSFFRAVSSEHRSKSGPRPSVVLIDELHEHHARTVVTKMRAGFKRRKNPMLMEITNSGFDRTSICWQHHEKSVAIMEGTQPDEQWFAYVCHLDPCQACYSEGYRQPKEGCANCDDWTDPVTWPKVNPSLVEANLPRLEYLHSQVNTGITLPAERSMIQRLNFCIWTQGHQIWIATERWNACKVPSVSADNSKGLAAAGGLDPSSTLDLTSLVVALRHDDGSNAHADDVEFEGMNEYGQMVRFAYRLNFHVELIPFFWLPEQTLLERVRTERIPYDVWRRDHRLFVTPGPAIDHNAVYDFTLKTVKGYKLQRLGMDENGGRYLFMRLRDDGRMGDQIVSVGQGKKLSEAFKFVEILAAHRRLWHDGHPVLAWNIANADPKTDPRTGARWLEKPSETRRIDGAIAMAMAIHQIMALPAHAAKPQMFFMGAKK